MNTLNLSQGNLGRGKFPLRRGGRGSFHRGLRKKPNMLSTSERGRGRGRSSSFGQIRSGGGRNIGRGGRGGIVHDRLDRIRRGNSEREDGKGFEFGGRNVYVEEDDEFDNDEVRVNFGFKESFEDSSVQFIEDEENIVEFYENPNENFREDFEVIENEDLKSLERSRKECIEKDIIKLDRERVEDLMYEEEQKRFESEKKTVERERKELENLRKTIESEKRKVEMLKRKVEEEEREERARSLSMGRDTKQNYDERLDELDFDNGSGDDSFENQSSRQSSIVRGSLKGNSTSNAVNKGNVQKKETACNNKLDNKKPLLKTPQSNEFCPSSNRMTAAGLLKFLNNRPERREADEDHNDMSRKELLNSRSRVNKSIESKAVFSGERSQKREFDIMQGPKRPDFINNNRGRGLGMMGRGVNSEQEHIRGRYELNQGSNRGGYNKVPTGFGGNHSQGPSGGGFNEGTGVGSFHGIPRERFEMNQGDGNFSKRLRRLSGVHDDPRGRFLTNQEKGGFNEFSSEYQAKQNAERFREISRRNFDSNQNTAGFIDGQGAGHGFNNELIEGGSKFIDNSRAGFSSREDWGLNKGVGAFGSNLGRGGFNENSRREFSSNFDTVGRFGTNPRLIGESGMPQNRNQGGFGGISQGQFNQFHRGNFPEMQKLESLKNQRFGRKEMPLTGGGMFGSTSMSHSERGFRNSVGGDPCAVSSRNFREEEYHYRGGEHSGGNFPNTGFGQPPNEYESSHNQQFAFDPPQAETWDTKRSETSFGKNKFMNMDRKPEPFPPPPFHGKRTNDERVQRILQRKKKKLLAAQLKLTPNQFITKAKIEKELDDIEVELREVSDKCYEQRQQRAKMEQFQEDFM